MEICLPNLLQLLLATYCLESWLFAHGALFSNNSHILEKRQASGCSSSDFSCDNSLCISKFQVCDGKADCTDKSDETAFLCNSLGLICPNYAFQCAYGACVDGHSKCNGVSDCLDNSDESLPECRPPPPTSAPPPPPVSSSPECLRNQHTCLSGQCIERNLLCNGRQDCDDGSDESRTTCKGNVQNGCNVPNNIPNGVFTLSECNANDTKPECIAKPGSLQPFGYILNVRCNRNYAVFEGPRSISCTSTKRWNPSTLPSCRRTCKPVTAENLIIKCSYSENINGRLSTREVSCKEPMFEGTKAEAKCPLYFWQKTDQFIFCLRTGQWDNDLTECRPICGYTGQSPNSPASLQPNINLGTVAKQTDFPWHAGIYLAVPQTTAKIVYKYICGGTLITTKSVLTAAHCGFFEESNQPIPLDDLFVALGKHKSTWEQDERGVQRFSVLDFQKPPAYFGKDDGYTSDVGIMFLAEPVKLSLNVIPICLNSSPHPLRQGSKFKVPGWGATGNKDTSEILLFAEIPFIPRQKCNSLLETNEKRALRYDKFCGGYLQRGPQTRRGDSGGGLVYKEGNTNFIVGIVSTSVSRENLYVSFFTNVSAHDTWIRTTLQKENLS